MENRLAVPRSQTLDTKAHFDRISARWSRNYDSGSGAMRRRIANFAAGLQGLPAGARVLDFGCGSGDITRALDCRGFVMTGIDLSPAMIEMARLGPGASNITWMTAHANGVALPFANAVFDAALASSVLEYHPDPAAQIVEIARVLRSGGVFVFTAPDMCHAVRRREKKWRWLAKSWLWPLLRLTPRRDYFEYLRVSVNRWPLESWLAAVREAGFEVQAPAQRDEPLVTLVCRKPM
jgi:ubiquinone/menaquinone biosynthesis C-methylase UbiE